MNIEKRLEVRVDRFHRITAGSLIKADVILIGDRPGPAAPEQKNFLHVPFNSLKHCSGWLNKQLEENDIPESRLAWVNAYDKKGNPTDPDIVDFVMGKPVVYALGGNAEKWCKKMGVHYDCVFPHPQYWKRFKSKESYPLIDRLIYVMDIW